MMLPLPKAPALVPISFAVLFTEMCSVGNVVGFATSEIRRTDVKLCGPLRGTLETCVGAGLDP